MVACIYMFLSTKIEVLISSGRSFLFCRQYHCTEGQLNSGVDVAGILDLFSIAGVVDVGADVEASSEAW